MAKANHERTSMTSVSKICVESAILYKINYKKYNIEVSHIVKIVLLRIEKYSFAKSIVLTILVSIISFFMFSTTILSPLGDLYALADDTYLLMLEFVDSKELSSKKEKVQKLSARIVHDGINPILTQTKIELDEYFAGKRKNFSLPLSPSGTDFQERAWKALEQIPYGETRSYLEEATMIGNPKAVRAIGGANHHNPIVIVIPCHRVIGKSGKLI